MTDRASYVMMCCSQYARLQTQNLNCFRKLLWKKHGPQALHRSIYSCMHTRSHNSFCSCMHTSLLMHACILYLLMHAYFFVRSCIKHVFATVCLSIYRATPARGSMALHFDEAKSERGPQPIDQYTSEHDE